MFRKILIAVAASLSLLSPLALPDQSEAREVAVRHHHRYQVMYRTCNAEPWRSAGFYGFRADAFREVHRLQHRGFEAIMR